MRKIKHPRLLKWEAVATMVGTIIGAGILGIPFSIIKAGFWTGILVLILVWFAVLFLNLFVGEIVLRVKQPKQLPGYAEYFLGKWAKFIFAFLMIFGILGGLLAYIVGVGESLQALFGGNAVFWGTAFGIIFSYIVFRGITMIKSFELVMLSVVLVIILAITLFSKGHFNFSNLSGFNLSRIFIPYGVALFAYGGMSSIRPVREILFGYEKKLKNVIVISTTIPLIVYIFFSFVVVSVTGLNTTQIATIGLGKVVGPHLIGLGNAFAIFAMGTSFLTIAIALRETLEYDYKIPKLYSWMMTCFIPLGLYLLGWQDFIKILGFVGAIGGGIQGILVVLMYWKSKNKGNRKPEYILGKNYLMGTILIVMFILGVFMALKDFS